MDLGLKLAGSQFPVCHSSGSYFCTVGVFVVGSLLQLWMTRLRGRATRGHLQGFGCPVGTRFEVRSATGFVILAITGLSGPNGITPWTLGLLQ